MLKTVAFECRVVVKRNELLVSYSIRNDRDEDLGVFNKIRATGTDGGTDFSPDRVFVDVEGTTLRLLKMCLPVPANLGVYAVIPPNASLLRAHETLTEAFRVPIPVRVQHPYKRAMIEGEVIPVDPRPVDSVQMCVGIFPLHECELVSEHPAFPSVLTASPPHPAVTQQLVLTSKVSLDEVIRVLDYKGFPWP